MDLRKLIFTENDCYKAGRKMIPKGIMLHSTGANNPYLSRYVGPDDGHLGKNIYNNHWNQKMSRGVCYHAFAGYLKDKKGIAIYQVLPWNHRGWHAGSGKKGSANDGFVSIGICEDGLNNKLYAMEVLQEVTEWAAYICKLYKLNPLGQDVIIDHARGHAMGIASNHGDILHWFSRYGVTLNSFRLGVKAVMEQNTPTPVPPAGGELWRLNVGAEIHKTLPALLDKSGTYTIVEKQGNYGKLKSGAGWVDLREAEKRDVTPTPTPAPTIKVGSKVKLKPGTHTYDGKSGLASWLFSETLIVQRIETERVWVGFEAKGATTATVNVANLILQ